MPLALRSQTDERNWAVLVSPLRVCLQAVYFDWSLRTVRILQPAEGDLLWSLKGPLVHINVMEKRGESATRSGGEVNATMIT